MLMNMHNALLKGHSTYCNNIHAAWILLIGKSTAEKGWGTESGKEKKIQPKYVKYLWIHTSNSSHDDELQILNF